MKYCEKCGKELADEVKFCMACGCAVKTAENEKETVTEVITEPIEDKTGSIILQEENDEVTNDTVTNSTSEDNGTADTKKKFIISKKLIIIIAAVVAVLLVVGIIISNSVSLNKYKEKLESTYDSMTYGAEIAEQYATLESKVWYNSINNKSSTETDKYTKDEDGYYYSDFNDALSEFYNGEMLNYSLIETSVSAMQRNMSELKDCPSKFEDEYEALKELYIAYSELTDLVVGYSSYSYNTFSDALEEAKSNYKSARSSTRLLLD